MLGVARNLSVASLVLVCLACGGSSVTNFNAIPAPVHAQVVVSGLTMPMQYVADPVNTDLAYVIEKGGTVKLIVKDVLQPSLVLDISADVQTSAECGLLGMTFDPNFVSNHYVYLHYNAGTTTAVESRVDRFTMSADGTLLTDQYRIITIPQPTVSHKGGSINFGPDGMFYMAMGDGGVPENDDNSAQDPQSLRGKVLRIDVSHDSYPADNTKNYSIPSNNPYANSSTVLPEIWAAGLRNPYRWSFDKSSGAMIIADVGQDFWEELNYIPNGVGKLNFGWRIKEGDHDFMSDMPAFSNTLTGPFLAIEQPYCRALVGGFVYRGRVLDASLRGRYFFADATTSRVMTIPFSLSGSKPSGLTQTDITEHTTTINESLSLSSDSLNLPVSVSPDAFGEVMIVELAKGKILRLIP